MAVQFRRTYRTVRRILTNAGVPIRKQGGRYPSVSECDDLIRQLTAQGMTNRDIAAATGVGQTKVGQVCAAYWREQC